MNKNLFTDALKKLDVRFEQLKPELELTVRDPDLGVEGYVVVWSTLAAIGGPLGRTGKGGTRITPQVSLEEIGMLARIMTLKNAAAGLPLGGAKSGLKADPAAPEFERKYRRFIQLVRPVLVEHGGPFGGFGFDIGGRPEHALWACDELKSYRCFTGKPVELGGTDYDREGIAGLGVAVAAKAALEIDEGGAKGVTCAIQGVGAMGAAVARYFTEFGGVVRYIADPRLGGTLEVSADKSKAVVEALARQDLESVKKLLPQKPEAVGEVLYKEVGVLFPCAVQEVITESNVAKVRACLVVEGANNPCSAFARNALFERGIRLVPDFIANPGGIIAAFVELTSMVSAQENAKTRSKVEEAKRFTREKIAENVHTMLSLCKEAEATPSDAGRYMALTAMFRDR